MIALPSGFSLQEYLDLKVQSMSAFEEYLLITSTQQQIDIFRRDDYGWRSQIYSMGETFTLESIHLNLTANDLYRGTSLKL